MRRWVYFGFAAILALVGMSSVPAEAQDAKWTPWHSVDCPKLGCNLSVSFSQVVNTNTWTWKFRNDGTQSVYIQFEYTYIDADSGQLTKQPDMFPKALAPGEAWGGWATYTANARWNPYSGGNPVTFRITSVTVGN
jgi:hypothetical protein